MGARAGCRYSPTSRKPTSGSDRPLHPWHKTHSQNRQLLSRSVLPRDEYVLKMRLCITLQILNTTQHYSFFKISTARFLAYQSEGTIPTKKPNTERKHMIIIKSTPSPISLRFIFLSVITLKNGTT